MLSVVVLFYSAAGMCKIARKKQESRYGVFNG